MSCTNPVLAVSLGLDPTTGKLRVKILPKRADYNLRTLEERYGKDTILGLPCGHCPSCIAARRKEWMIRCGCEAKQYKDNCFITLTYDDEHCPSKLIKRDLQLFIKDLRNRGLVIRYFASGEYGGQTGRPHYHVILFNFKPTDLKYLCKSHKGFDMFTSKFVEESWKKGNVTIQDFTPETAGYVAGYVEKKLDKDDGFILMSTRPGIGKQYVLDNYQRIYKYDYIMLDNGFKGSIPRYFDKCVDGLVDVNLADVKQARIDAANICIREKLNLHGMVNREELYKYDECIMKDKLERRKRKL